MPEEKGENRALSRRAFLGSSVTATVASMITPVTTAFPAVAGEHSREQASPSQPKVAFRSAKPIWPRGRETEMNLFVGFRALFEASPGRQVYLRVAGATLLRIYINGKFLSSGPARGPHGFFRVDLLDITPLLVAGKNSACIEVAGYNVNSYYVLNQPSFLQAEITDDANVIASTAGKGKPFEAKILSQRVQKVQRYTFQRGFSEVYRIDQKSDEWREHADAAFAAVPCVTSESRSLVPRRVPYPQYTKRQPEQTVSAGTFHWIAKGPKSLAEDNTVPFRGKISSTLLGFTEQEMEVVPYLELQRAENAVNDRVDMPYVSSQGMQLQSKQFKILDFGTNLTGFIGVTVEVKTPTKLYVAFDEALTDGDVDFTRLNCVNIIAYTLAPGSYNLESFEPYVLRFLKPMVLEGECEIRNLYLREFTAPDVWTAHFSSSDEGLNELFAAAREGYRANAVDLFTDTPSRERSGWLCDSSFTAPVAPLLSGHTLVEKCFFENYLLPEKFLYIPNGMLPMCYPADHYNENFTPNWSLWFLIQLEDYLSRSGDEEMVEAFRPRVLKLLEYFKPFQNEYGLLEKLKGWVFVEWSKSNDYVQDVNYPTNMLYAAALKAVARMYSLSQYDNQAESLLAAIRTQSYDGEFFVDNAIRRGGQLVPTKNRTETCQYYAFYFGAASREKYPELWEKLHTHFGPQRRETKAFPDIPPSNAFTGNVIRLELLSRAGLAEQLIQDAKAYFLPMAELTGTFWENMGNEASMNHAFGSHIIVALYRDVLGIYRLDTVHKSVHVRFTSSSIQMCEGRIPTPDGFVFMRWTKTSGVLTYQLDIPAGYSVEVENQGETTIAPKKFPHGKVTYGYKIEGGYK